MYEDDEDELDNNNSILIADLDWKPQSNLFDYSLESFAPDIVKRLQGITEESFATEVEMWQAHLNILPSFDEFKIRTECNGWDISIPKRDDFMFTFNKRERCILRLIYFSIDCFVCSILIHKRLQKC